jgi:hypothetical protein
MYAEQRRWHQQAVEIQQPDDASREIAGRSGRRRLYIRFNHAAREITTEVSSCGAFRDNAVVNRSLKVAHR